MLMGPIVKGQVSNTEPAVSKFQSDINNGEKYLSGPVVHVVVLIISNITEFGILDKSVS